MLKMRGERSVERPRRPFVGVGAHVFDRSVAPRPLHTMPKFRADIAKHRLDRQHHSLAQLDSPSALAVVVNLRILMHPPSDSMSDKIADHVKAFRLRVLLYRGADVAEVLAGNHFLDGKLQTFPRRLDQLLRSR